jgi:hypothetical protein
MGYIADMGFSPTWAFRMFWTTYIDRIGMGFGTGEWPVNKDERDGH